MTVMVDDVTEVEEDQSAEAPDSSRKPSWRLSRGKLVVGAVIAAVIVGLALWMFSWSSPIPVREVVVVGSLPESTEKIEAAAGIELGTPLRDVDAEAVVARVVGVESVEAADLEYIRPWTVSINVEERVPFFLQGEKKQWVLLDQAGDPIREVSGKPPKLPVVSGERGRWPELVTALSALDAKTRQDVAQAEIGSDGVIVFGLRQGSIVEWGRSEQNEQKAMVLTSLLPREADVFVVSTPERPAMRGDVKLPKKNRGSEPDPPESQPVEPESTTP